MSHQCELLFSGSDCMINIMINIRQDPGSTTYNTKILLVAAEWGAGRRHYGTVLGTNAKDLHKEVGAYVGCLCITSSRYA
jgi:hypothetical protein